MKVVILGGGTLSEFILDIIAAIPDMQIFGIYDDRYPELQQVQGVPVLGTMRNLTKKDAHNVVLGIGDPILRKKLYKEKSALGFSFPTLIHPTCVISPKAKIDPGVVIGPMSTVLSGSYIGCGACLLSCVNVNQDVTIGPFSLVGARAVFGNGASVGEGSHVGMAYVLKMNEAVTNWEHVG